MHYALFEEFVEIIFKFSADLGVWNESTVKSGIFPRQRFETCCLKNVELWVYVAHQILQQSACHNHVLNYMSVQNLAQT